MDRQTSPHPWLMCVSLCVAGRSEPRRYAALHRCASLYPSVSCNLAGRAMFNIALLWWIYCSKPHTVFTRGCQASSDHDPFRSNTHPPAQRETLGVTYYLELQEPICEEELGVNVTKDGDKRYLSHTQRNNKLCIHCPNWLVDIK